MPKLRKIEKKWHSNTYDFLLQCFSVFLSDFFVFGWILGGPRPSKNGTKSEKIDFLSKKNIIRLKIFTSFLSLLFFLILFYFGFLMVEEAFTKNYSTGTVWDPPLWIPYSSMMLGAILMILQYIAEIIKLTDEKDYN